MKDINKQILINLKKSRTHIDKIISMQEGDAYCIDVIQQLNAVIGYLKSAKSKKLEEHLHSCFINEKNTKTKKQREELVDELLKVTKIT